ncbi:MAG: prephenate dehydrogenase/arogenate dehydrogenase family protein [Thermoanaerobaculia bacterium]
MRATLVGLGLIGGSIGKVLTASGWNVDFIDPAVSESEAIEARAASRKLGSPSEIDAESTLILGMPVDVSMHMLATEGPLANLVTSVASVMAPLEIAARSRGWRFVAGHPLAGSHERGLSNARPDLFRGCRWFMAPDYAGTAVEEIIALCGADPVVVDSDTHDRSLALTSHLPQLLSTALASVVAQHGIDLEKFAGTGLRSFLRLAGSSRIIWHSVIETNGINIDAALHDLATACDQILDGDDELHFEQANRIWETLD